MTSGKDQSYKKHRKARPATHKPKGTKRDKHLKDIELIISVLGFKFYLNNIVCGKRGIDKSQAIRKGAKKKNES